MIFDYIFVVSSGKQKLSGKYRRLTRNVSKYLVKKKRTEYLSRMFPLSSALREEALDCSLTRFY